MLEKILCQYPRKLAALKLPPIVEAEAKRRVLDSIACFAGAYDATPIKKMRAAFLPNVSGEATVWGTRQTAPGPLAAWVNGAAVRALDYNDTYLSKEPCHPSDLLASVWAACEHSGRDDQGKRLLRGLVLGYDVMCRLCDAASLRLRGWDHVTYLPVASAVACASVFDLSPDETREAIALAMTGNIAMRQTRVGSISDWKAACASYGARAGLWAAILAKQGFTGPRDIFSGKHGFITQVSGPMSWLNRPLGKPWRMLDTHTKFFPAEHHAQSAIEAALALRPFIKPSDIVRIEIHSFDASVDIIGSEPEKWQPTTRETADHSLPYLVVVALLDGDVNLEQFEAKRFLDADVRKLLKRVQVMRSAHYSRLYPAFLPNRVAVFSKDRLQLSQEVLLPAGYAGRPMTDAEIENKFHRMGKKYWTDAQRVRIVNKIKTLEKAPKLAPIAKEWEI